MAIVGSVDDTQLALRGYEQDSLHQFAEAFLDVAKAGLNEGVSMFDDPGMYCRRPATKEALKQFFIKESYDPKDPRFNAEIDPYNAAKNIEAHCEHMGRVFENDVKCIVNESSPLGAFNPVIGMALPMHKNILMNAVFDQIMPKDVAQSPKFTLTMETRVMYDTNNNRIDMFLEQNKITDAINNSVPQMDIIIPLPEYEATDILKDKFNITGAKANLSIKSHISGVIASSWVKPGDSYYDTTTQTVKKMATTDTAGMKPVIFDTGRISYTPTYGDYDRILSKKISIVTIADAAGTEKVISGNLTGHATKDNKFAISFVGPDSTAVTAVRFHAVVDISSAAFKTVKFNWEARTDFFEIPEQPHVTCTVSPESVKDIQALYDVNQITKLMSMMRLGLLHWKDDNIHRDLDDSFLSMPDTQKVTGAIDWAPPVGQFNGTPVQWRQEMFIDQLDMYVSRMLNVLHDENMGILVVGRPEIIKRITPQQFQYQAPSNIGPVELDFQRTIVTSEKRVYNFVSSQKMFNNNNLIIMLIPRNSMRITYKIVDYQLYVSNEIRDTEQYELPGMTCFERWLFLQYQPVQGRIQIMNVAGTREQIENPDPIGRNAMNDDTANYSTYASGVNGVAKTAGEFVGQAKQ